MVACCSRRTSVDWFTANSTNAGVTKERNNASRMTLLRASIVAVWMPLLPRGLADAADVGLSKDNMA